jgi:putative N6-adenine-specific DNA methylase
LEVVVKTLHGLEEVLAEELKDLGGKEVAIRNRAVSANGNIAFVYRINYAARTALRVLIPIHTFKAKSDQELYTKIRDFDWSVYMTIHQTFAIDPTIFSEYFKHSKFASLKMKDAMVDGFRAKYGKRPNVDIDNPDVRFNLHIYKDQVTISLDSSGTPLNQRGYRPEGHAAPLNEILAAGMLKLAKWEKSIPLVDPFCGTGTILVEAAMMAQHIPPQHKRDHFGFRTWSSFEPMIWNQVKAEELAKVRKSDLDITGGDIDPDAAVMARKSLKMAGVGRQVKVKEVSFEKNKPVVESGMIITNPPYGERIGERINDLYHEMGDAFKHNFEGFDVWVLSSNQKALKQLRLKPTQQIDLFNGSLECQFCKYEMYSGTKEVT